MGDMTRRGGLIGGEWPASYTCTHANFLFPSDKCFETGTSPTGGVVLSYAWPGRRPDTSLAQSRHEGVYALVRLTVKAKSR